jgi:hypothetical protein
LLLPALALLQSCSALPQTPSQLPVAQLRLVLDAAQLTYPDDHGMFVERRERRTEPDWEALISGVPLPPGLWPARAEMLDVVRRIHACGDPATLLEWGFSVAGSPYRDEVGRRVRALGDPAVPTLIRIAFSKAKPRRYANWQLDRMDRQRPEAAMAQIRDDRLRAEVLRAWGEVLAPQAVHVVLGECDASSPRVRKAARWAWLQYVTRKPSDPPKRKLKLTGGKQTEEEKELYLSTRELADLEIRRQWPALMNEPANPERSLAELSEALFARQDAERTRRFAAWFAQAQAKEGAGDWAGAVGLYNWILAQDPFYSRRGEMAGAYRALAAQLPAAQADGWRRQAAALAGEPTPTMPPARAAADAPAQRRRGRVVAALAAALAALVGGCALAWRGVRA